MYRAAEDPSSKILTRGIGIARARASTPATSPPPSLPPSPPPPSRDRSREHLRAVIEEKRVAGAKGEIRGRNASHASPPRQTRSRGWSAGRRRQSTRQEIALASPRAHPHAPPLGRAWVRAGGDTSPPRRGRAPPGKGSAARARRRSEAGRRRRRRRGPSPRLIRCLNRADCWGLRVQRRLLRREERRHVGSHRAKVPCWISSSERGGSCISPRARPRCRRARARTEGRRADRGSGPRRGRRGTRKTQSGPARDGVERRDESGTRTRRWG